MMYEHCECKLASYVSGFRGFTDCVLFALTFLLSTGTMLSLAARSASRAMGASATRAIRAPVLSQANVRNPILSLRRFESSKTLADEVGRLRSEAQADWVAPVITYERVKELTEQPTEVRLETRSCGADSQR